MSNRAILKGTYRRKTGFYYRSPKQIFVKHFCAFLTIKVWICLYLVNQVWRIRTGCSIRLLIGPLIICTLTLAGLDFTMAFVTFGSSTNQNWWAAKLEKSEKRSLWNPNRGSIADANALLERHYLEIVEQLTKFNAKLSFHVPGAELLFNGVRMWL